MGESRKLAILRKRLQWLNSVVEGLKFLLGDDVITQNAIVEETPDPIAVIVTLPLGRPIVQKSRAHLRTFFREWAKVGDCHIPRIMISDHFIRAEILTKHRHVRSENAL